MTIRLTVVLKAATATVDGPGRGDPPRCGVPADSRVRASELVGSARRSLVSAREQVVLDLVVQAAQRGVGSAS